MKEKIKLSEDAPHEAGPILDVDMVSALAAVVERHGLSELKLNLSGGSLIIRRGQTQSVVHAVVSPPPTLMAAPVPLPSPATLEAGPAPTSPAPSPPPAPATNGQYLYVSSPFVGTFYRSPSPGSPPFVEVGQRVKKGQVMCIVEAMKLMNEIESDVDGVVSAIMVDNAAPVEYGQALYRLTPG